MGKYPNKCAKLGSKFEQNLLKKMYASFRQYKIRVETNKRSKDLFEVTLMNYVFSLFDFSLKD